jgi:toxin-antitoxin system PIN domain toxin
VVLIDANLLIYAVFRDSLQHDLARVWLDATLSGGEAVALPWAVLAAFIRLGTNPRVMTQPLTLDEAIEHVKEWLDLPIVRVVVPTDRHRGIFLQVLQDAQATGNLVSDAHLAALAIEHGCRVASTDEDFARFSNLRWFNPLAAGTSVELPPTSPNS